MSFSETLQQLGNGQVYQDLGDKLVEIVQAVQDTRKIGELSLTLKIKPNGEYGITIADTVKAKVPERARGETMFFANAAGHLMRNDPRQQDLPLRRLETGINAPLRTIDNTSEVLVNG